MMWKKGVKYHNISPIMKIKKIAKISYVADYSGTDQTQKFYPMDATSEKCEAILGNDKENFYIYERLADYKKFVCKRITTKVKNFLVHRIVRTKIGEGDKAVVQEDKITITDPTIYFFRDSDGDGYPGGTTAGQFEEYCKKKCIRGCWDGWHWTTNFRTKHERKMNNCTALRAKMANMAQTSKNQLLKVLGVEPIDYGDNATLNDVHSCKFGIGREAIFPVAWFDDATSILGKTERTVSDHVTFDMCSWITIRCFRKVM